MANGGSGGDPAAAAADDHPAAASSACNRYDDAAPDIGGNGVALNGIAGGMGAPGGNGGCKWGWFNGG